MEKKNLFRQKTLEEYNSPERIDEYVHITSPSVYGILITLGILAGALIIWSILGNVTDKANIGGLVFPTNGIVGVSLPNEGTVRDMFVAKGDYVKKNQSIALVSVQESYSILSAPYDGVILSAKPKNEHFNAFEPIANLVYQGKERQVETVVAFANFSTARDLKPGMEAQVSPVNMPREKYGYIYGKILNVSKYPITRTEAIQEMKVESFTDDVFPKEGSAFKVEIALYKDSKDAANFLWSFPPEGAVDMGVGTFCNIQIITKKRSILHYLFEQLRFTANTIALWID